MAKVINSTVHLAKESGDPPVVIPAGTELSGDYAWVEDTLKSHGTYDRLVEGEFDDFDPIAALAELDQAETAEGEATDLDKLNVDELRALASERGIADVDQLKKPALIKALREQAQ